MANEDLLGSLSFEFDIYNEDVLDFIKERSYDFWDDVAETSKQSLRKVLATATAESYNTEELATAVRKVFGDQTPYGTYYRAKRIARTETTIALNQGADLAYKQSNVVKKKSWLTSGDEVVRQTHIGAEMQGPIDYDTPFWNGLQFPGDPNGRLKELVNCRCSLVPEVGNENVETEYARQSDKFNQSMEDFEEGIVDKKIEWSKIWDGQGNEILLKTGTHNQVNFTNSERDLIRNSKAIGFSHNHPVSGGAPSANDLGFASQMHMSWLRAVGRTYDGKRVVYTLRHKDGSPFSGYELFFYDGLYKDYNNARSIIMAKYQKKLIHGEFTTRESHQKVLEEAWQKLIDENPKYKKLELLKKVYD